MNNEAKVGAIAILGLSLLATIVLYLSGVNFGTGGYPLNVVFSQVNGLAAGNTVSYSGVYIGTVKAISITPRGIKVELIIDSKVKIPQKSKFTITSAGLLGEQYVNIIPNTQTMANDAYMAPDDTVYGEPPYGIDVMMQLGSETMQEMKEAVNSLNQILSDKNMQNSLKEIIGNLDQLTGALSKLAVDNQDRINEMVINLTLISKSMLSMAEHFDTMTASLDNKGQTTAEIKELIANLTSVSRRLDKMAASMENVVADPKTVQDLKTIIGNTKEVSEKANAIVNKTSLKTSASLEMLYDFKDHKYNSSASLKVGDASAKTFGIIGVSGIGDSNWFNLQYGRSVARWTERMGIIDGKVGLGADASLGKDFKISLDVYDPNDVKYKMRLKYNIMPDLAVIGQTDRDQSRPSLWHNYFGLQRTF
jgi:phospholipid/cholesterol/gamma-HCH transport system substrate-binding protein